MKPIKLTSHIRHARLVKIVRRSYQELNKGSRLFNNTSGTGYQGLGIAGAGEIVLKNPRVITFGIPGNKDGSGGADLLGWTMKRHVDHVDFDGIMKPYDVEVFKPIFTGIECKSGNGRLMKNQVIFKKILLGHGGIYHIARECPTCWEHWTPIYKSGRIIEWVPVKDCPTCKGLGYGLEE